ncbi:hypothetical protein RRG08_011356 [Elysia crispata]|uniref:Uncharacterized protein n=1 Tax=Elysia crispata TaxID=231223 RepID=A0AAE1CZM4_9GAST|nr:hypothetical protein RRG08_011356 [Elysia crispata]
MAGSGCMRCEPLPGCLNQGSNLEPSRCQLNVQYTRLSPAPPGRMNTGASSEAKLSSRSPYQCEHRPGFFPQQVDSVSKYQVSN